MADRIARDLVVRGRVQGVFYRAWVREAAAGRRVAGWAKNRIDGAVAVRLEGNPAAVDHVEMVCRKGPPSARVDSVQVTEALVENLHGFSVR